jgi:hypothetical protein
MSKLSNNVYTADAIDRAQVGAQDWLLTHDEGFPRTWDQENADNARRGYELYERDFEAPPIAGYEALASAGICEFVGVLQHGTQVRAHFRLTDAGRLALKNQESDRG